MLRPRTAKDSEALEEKLNWDVHATGAPADCASTSQVKELRELEHPFMEAELVHQYDLDNNQYLCYRLYLPLYLHQM
uniref:Uncharacterized protein n=1 Tax=Physcomitrium patens TaxID=3218 RepID=A0A2K1JVL2_PHYPA|nr:hypothetical protein PHYPA_015339 [Physcomitrium patens]